MKAESIVLALAGAFFGLIVGWILGSQQAGPPRAAIAPQAQMQVQGQPAGQAPAPKVLDERQAQTLRQAAERDPTNAQPRVELANLYFDAERFDEAVKWYSDALKLDPRNADVSTDLGFSYYRLNQPDQALKQFDYSLKVDPRHAKTMWNIGVVRAFGKQDLDGAIQAWQKLVATAPDSPEGQNAKGALDRLKAAHPGTGDKAAEPAPTKTTK